VKEENNETITRVADLNTASRNVNLHVKVLEKSEPKEVTSRRTGETHRVSEILIGDESGTILLSAWDDMIEKIETGKTYDVKNAYISVFQNSMRLSLGKYSTITQSDEEIADEDINRDNNMSSKTVQYRPRSRGRRRSNWFDRGRRRF